MRKLTDFALFFVTFMALFYLGAGWWALLIIPFGLWNYADGLERGVRIGKTWSSND